MEPPRHSDFRTREAFGLRFQRVAVLENLTDVVLRRRKPSKFVGHIVAGVADGGRGPRGIGAGISAGAVQGSQVMNHHISRFWCKCHQVEVCFVSLDLRYWSALIVIGSVTNEVVHLVNLAGAVRPSYVLDR